MLRIGSDGGIGEDVKLRDLVIAMTASTNLTMLCSISSRSAVSQADYKLLRTAVELGERGLTSV